jgi:hypothetical protein
LEDQSLRVRRIQIFGKLIYVVCCPCRIQTTSLLRLLRLLRLLCLLRLLRLLCLLRLLRLLQLLLIPLFSFY